MYIIIVERRRCTPEQFDTTSVPFSTKIRKQLFTTKQSAMNAVSDGLMELEFDEAKLEENVSEISKIRNKTGGFVTWLQVVSGIQWRYITFFTIQKMEISEEVKGVLQILGLNEYA
jgi:hypothetical protein